MICPKCEAEMYQIFGENANEGFACICGYYFWLDKGANRNDLSRG